MRFFSLVLLTLPAGLSASPMGATACGGGMAAVGPPHTTAPDLTTGSLSDGGFSVMIDDMTLSTDSMTSVMAGQDYEIKIMGADFKGFLIRVDKNSNGDSAALTEMSDMAKTAAVCTDGVAGITHTDNTVKTSVAGSLNVPEDGEYPVDVTIVLSCKNGTSEYYYTGYSITADSSGDLPSETADPNAEAGSEDPSGDDGDDTSAAVDGFSLMVGAFSMALGSVCMMLMM